MCNMCSLAGPRARFWNAHMQRSLYAAIPRSALKAIKLEVQEETFCSREFGPYKPHPVVHRGMVVSMTTEVKLSALLVGEYKGDRPLVKEVFRRFGWKLFEARDRRRA